MSSGEEKVEESVVEYSVIEHDYPSGPTYRQLIFGIFLPSSTPRPSTRHPANPCKQDERNRQSGWTFFFFFFFLLLRLASAEN